ncbi:HEAT repeat domain-containing protein [Streptomyces zaomyceticus]|uniref:HEAT repeat domain-containing protein n=1 Tax=Streptomyces zaomyceticus TaxID=68286 RepID=UPI00364825DA
MKMPWRAKRKKPVPVEASAPGSMSAGGNINNSHTEVHYHVHQPADAIVSGSGDIAPTVIFEARPGFPKLEFSIVNRGRTPIQITAIRVLKAASIKSTINGEWAEHLRGRRLQLDFNLQTAGQGSWVSAFPGEVSNLGPYEAEPFTLDLSTTGTLNLVDIEFEYISAATPHVLMARPSEIIYVDSPLMRIGYPGSIQLISREAALSSLLDGTPVPIHGPAIEHDPEDAKILFLRGVAHLRHDDVSDVWTRVAAKFGDSPDFGPAVASFAEFGRTCGLPDSVSEGLEAWLGDPAAIRRAPNWDNESHSRIVHEFLIPELPPQLGLPEFSISRSAARCFKILDSTLSLPPTRHRTTDGMEFVRFVLRESTLSLVREDALRRLVDCYGVGAIEYVVVNLRLSSLGDIHLDRLLKETLGDDAPPENSSLDGDVIQERWRSWWESHENSSVYTKLAWRPLSPRIARAARALSARIPGDVPADMDELVMMAVARNPYVLDHFAGRLAREADAEVRREMAAGRHASPKTLDILARDPSPIVRRWVAVNSNTSEKTLASLRDDESEEVRSALLENPRFSSE